MAVLARGVVVDRATILEWPQIEALRQAYFDGMKQAVVRRDDQTAWWVARVGERVDGCYSSVDVPHLEQRWILDFYRAPGRRGTVALAAMYAQALAAAKTDQLDLMFHVDFGNPRQQKSAAGHGFTPLGVLFGRPWRSI